MRLKRPPPPQCVCSLTALDYVLLFLTLHSILHINEQMQTTTYQSPGCMVV